MEYELINVERPIDWQNYHAIRRVELFEERGRLSLYDENYPDEFLQNNHPLLFKHKGKAIGTVRLDDLKNKDGVVRLVAIKKEMQGKGHGRVLGDMLEKHATDLGINKLYVNADPEAVGYYERLGWKEYSWNLDELVGMAKKCQQMIKVLRVASSTKNG